MIEYLPYILSQISQPMNILLLIFGNIIGIIFGAIPGLSGTLAVMLFLPLTYSMVTGTAIIFLLSLWIGGTSGAFIGSVLLGIPGSPSALATCFDGYPMTLKGQAGKALAIGMVGSCIGTFFGSLFAMILSEFIAEIAFLLGPWEYFALCLLAITLVIAISRGNMFKGLASASLGILFSSVGYSSMDSVQRFTFDNVNLIGGLSMFAVLLGVFGISKILVDYGNGFPTIGELDRSNIRGIGITIKEIRDQTFNIIRSFMIGLWIGFLPGMGPGLSNIVSYSSAKNAAKNPESFGTGNPTGLWASEVANNASIGGAMIPMTALGIPGDTTTAILIGALTIHGLEMGPMVFKNSGNIIYLMFVTVMLCAVVVLLLQFIGIRVFPLVLKIPNHFMYPSLLILLLTNAYTESSSMFDIGLILIFAVVGVIMNYGGLPTSPFILSFILGPIMEINLMKAFQYSGTIISFFTRPISAIFITIAILSVFSPIIIRLINKYKLK